MVVEVGAARHGIRTAAGRPRLSRLGAACALCLGLALGLPQAASAAGDLGAAKTLVEKHKLGAGMKVMAFAAAARTDTYANLVKAVGQPRAEAAVVDQLNQLEPKYQPRWDANLAQAYTRHFSTAELKSISDKGTESPDAAKFTERGNAVGADMLKVSAPLLSEMVTESLVRAAAQLQQEGGVKKK